MNVSLLCLHSMPKVECTLSTCGGQRDRAVKTWDRACRGVCVCVCVFLCVCVSVCVCVPVPVPL